MSEMLDAIPVETAAAISTEEVAVSDASAAVESSPATPVDSAEKIDLTAAEAELAEYFTNSIGVRAQRYEADRVASEPESDKPPSQAQERRTRAAEYRRRRTVERHLEVERTLARAASDARRVLERHFTPRNWSSAKVDSLAANWERREEGESVGSKSVVDRGAQLRQAMRRVVVVEKTGMTFDTPLVGLALLTRAAWKAFDLHAEKQVARPASTEIELLRFLEYEAGRKTDRASAKLLKEVRKQAEMMLLLSLRIYEPLRVARRDAERRVREIRLAASRSLVEREMRGEWVPR